MQRKINNLDYKWKDLDYRLEKMIAEIEAGTRKEEKEELQKLAIELHNIETRLIEMRMRHRMNRICKLMMFKNLPPHESPKLEYKQLY